MGKLKFTLNKLLPCTALLIVVFFMLLQCLNFFNVIIIHSDAFMEQIGVTSFFKNGWSSWNTLLFTFAPDFFPDYLSYYLISFFNSNVVDRIFLTTLIQVLLLPSSAVLLLQSFNFKNLLPSSILIILITTLYIYMVVPFPHFWLWYYAANDNLGATINGMLSLPLLMTILRNKRAYKYVIFFIWNTFNIISCRLFLVTFIGPTVLTLLFYSVIIKKLRIVTVVNLLLIFTSSFLLATKFIEPFYMPFATVTEKFNASLGLSVALHNFLATIPQFIQYYNTLAGVAFVIWLVTTLYIAIFAVRQRKILFKKNSNNDMDLGFLIVFVIFAVPLNLIAPIASGIFLNAIHNYRYFSTLVALPQVVSIGLIVSKYQKVFRSKTFYGFILLIISPLVVISCSNLKLTMHSIRLKRHINIPIADCLDRNKARYHLIDGLSDYWTAYPVNVFSKESFLLPVCSNLMPCSILDYRQILKDENTSTKRKRNYNFIVITNDDQFAFYRDKLTKIAGQPSESFFCPNRIEVLVYGKKGADIITKKVIEYSEISLFKAGLTKEMLFKPSSPLLLKFREHDITAAKKNLAINEKSAAGIWLGVLYGDRLPSGKYKIVLDADIQGADDKPVLILGYGLLTNIDFKNLSNQTWYSKISHLKGETVIGQFNLKFSELKYGYGLWVYYTGNGKASFNKLKLIKTS